MSVSLSNAWNGWQLTDSNPPTWLPGSYGPVYACWKIISEELARVPLIHVGISKNGSVERIHNSAAARFFRQPNRYQTRSDFMLRMGLSLLSEGNSYGRGIRNGRNEIVAIYPINPRACYPHVETTTGDVLYQNSDSMMTTLCGVQDGGWLPARDVLHVRLFTPVHPLLGETPLTAAALSVNSGQSVNAHIASFFGNMARPSGIIRHPKTLQPEAIKRVKERFVEATSRNNSGAPVVLTEEMDWKPMSMSAVDAEIIATAKLTQGQIAEIYRVPPFMLGVLEQSKFATVESMIRFFVSSCLGFYLTHISAALTNFFELPIDEEIRFDTERTLLQSDFKEYADSLKSLTTSGVLSADEARGKLEMAPVANGVGKEPRVQQQMVPLSWGLNLPAPAATPAAPADPPAAKMARVEAMRAYMLGGTQ